MSKKYHKILSEFTSYLNTVGYGYIIQKQSYYLIKSFLLFTDKRTDKFNSNDILSFVSYLQSSISQKTGQKRSNVYINSYIHALNRFSAFLLHSRKQSLLINIPLLKVQPTTKTILSVAEIQVLFDCCEDDTVLGVRDKVILSLFYSCGLRCNEGINVQISDIDLSSKLLFVRKGKFGKQRYVPFNEFTHRIFKQYLSTYRKKLINNKVKNNYLLLGRLGKPLKEIAVRNRVKKLCQRSSIDKKIGLHSLRHSIATHLLHNGLTIYEVSEFLGHSSLESTQIYTHFNYDEK